MIGNILFEETAPTTPKTEVTSIDWARVWDVILDWMTSTGIKILVALVVMIVAFKLINFICKRVTKRLEKRNADPTLSKTLVIFARVLLKILVVVALIGYLGFETASISAVIAAAGMGISLAVQGTLSNIAAGVIIIIMRPFKLGDFITSGDYSGTVEDIKLYYTSIVSPDNKVIKIPNSTLANNVIVNASVKDERRVDLVMSIAYDADAVLAKKLLREVADNCPYVKSKPTPLVEIGQLADSSVDIYVRVWCNRPEYWKTYYYMLTEMKNVLDENNIEIPYNKLDVNIKKETE